eukprot:GHRQ01012487.1.p1 GENE.GHRQ01012487.1~~GHRQ01012487.1.p1  ORF type:complete len:137 (+),score=23.69 GHRQ01012487.1:121-531(+)
MGGLSGSPWYVTKNSSFASSPMVSISADTTLTLMSFSTDTMSTSRPGLSRVVTASRLQQPLGASLTSMVVCTTARALGPSGRVWSRLGHWKDLPATSDSELSCNRQAAAAADVDAQACSAKGAAAAGPGRVQAQSV